jgi:hypothetical protein
VSLRLRADVLCDLRPLDDLGGDEAAELIGRAADGIEAGYLAFVQPNVGKWGGVSGGLEIARYAAARNVEYCPHWLAGGVGLAASMHALAAAGGARGYAEVDANPNPLREEVFPLAVDDGWPRSLRPRRRPFRRPCVVARRRSRFVAVSPPEFPDSKPTLIWIRSAGRRQSETPIMFRISPISRRVAECGRRAGVAFAVQAGARAGLDSGFQGGEVRGRVKMPQPAAPIVQLPLR